MPIQNEKFSLLVSNSSGNPLTGALVELRKDATIYTTTEVGNGWYSIASIPTGKYSVFVDSVDTGETKAVGSGQVAALGNTADNVPVSNATEYDFQDPTTLKTTLSLENVTNVEVPEPTGSDANKVIQVDSNGDYVLSSIAASGFESIYEILTTSDLTAALSAEYDSKLLVITREDFNFANAQTFEVWGSCSIIVANTSEPFQWSSNAVNATFNLKSGADSSLTGMFFLNGVIAFGDNSDYTLNIPWKVTNLDFISPEVSRSVDGSSTLTYESLKASIPASVTVTTAQDWWQNSAGDKLDSVVAGSNITIDNTDPQNPIINVSDVLSLSSTTNASPTNGDIWYDGNEVNIQGIVKLRSQSLLGTNYISLKDSTGWGVRVDGSNDALRPLSDNDTSLGLDIRRWSNTYSVNGDFSGDVDVGGNLDIEGQTFVDATASNYAVAINQNSTGDLLRLNLNNTSIKFRVYNDGSTDVGGVLNLSSTTNASPTNGDIWYDGTEVNIQGILQAKTGSTTGEVKIGSDTGLTTNNQEGYRVRALSGSVFIDHKTHTGGTILYRCGQGTENGQTRTFMSVNPSNADVFIGSDLNVTGGLSVNASNINFSGLPTSSSGLSSGDLWRDGTDLKIVP